MKITESQLRRIIREMTATPDPTLSLPYETLIRYVAEVLQSNGYPRSWAEGIVSDIYESADEGYVIENVGSEVLDRAYDMQSEMEDQDE